MYKYISLLIIIIILYIIVYIRFLKKKNSDLTIYQLNYSNITTINKYFKIKSPTVIYPWLQYLPTLSKINLQYLYQKYPNIQLSNKKYTLKQFIDQSLNQKKSFYIEDNNFLQITNINSILKKELNILYPQLTNYTQSQLEIYPKNHTTQLQQTYNYRTILLQLEGIQKLILFNPNQTKFMHATKNKSKVNFWKINSKKFPKFSKSKYIEIIMRPGTIVYIPNYWWYTRKSDTDSLAITLTMDTYLSYLLNYF